jgi:hypothetical protein
MNIILSQRRKGKKEKKKEEDNIGCDNNLVMIKAYK